MPTETEVLPAVADVVDPAVAIENKVAPRVAEARLIVVVDQATLDLVGDRLAINKALQKEAESVFKPIKQKMDAAKKEVLDQEKRVTEPLQQEESILKLAANTFLTEQARIERIRLEKERLEREAEERRLLAEAEQKRAAEEKEINDRLAKEHAEEVERQIELAEARGSWPEDVAAEVEALIATPAPEPVHIPLDIPVMPAAAPRPVASIVAPKGMTWRVTVKAELTNLTLLCRAIGEGKAPVTCVTANMSVLTNLAKAGVVVPGVKAVEETGIAQKAR